MATHRDPYARRLRPDAQTAGADRSPVASAARRLRAADDQALRAGLQDAGAGIEARALSLGLAIGRAIVAAAYGDRW